MSVVSYVAAVVAPGLVLFGMLLDQAVNALRRKASKPTKPKGEVMRARFDVEVAAKLSDKYRASWLVACSAVDRVLVLEGMLRDALGTDCQIPPSPPYQTALMHLVYNELDAFDSIATEFYPRDHDDDPQDSVASKEG